MLPLGKMQGDLHIAQQNTIHFYKKRLEFLFISYVRSYASRLVFCEIPTKNFISYDYMFEFNCFVIFYNVKGNLLLAKISF